MIYSFVLPAPRRLMSTPARLFLIDGSSQMYRAYHAMRGSGLTGPGGRSTHAVYIFVTMLRKLMQDHHPQYIAASFDLPGPTFRSEMATDYKANRAPMPPDLAEQIPWVHEACEALGVPILTYADASRPTTSSARWRRRRIAAGLRGRDRHRRQGLLPAGARRHLKVYNPRDDGHVVRRRGREGEVRRAPEQVVDVLALMGDSIDNIKGVPGIGEKGARDLIAKYGIARGAAGARRRDHATSAIAKGCSITPTTPGRAASWRGSAPTCRSTSIPTRCVPRRLAREVLRAVHAARLPLAGRWSSRRPPQTVGKDYVVVDTVDGAARAGRELRARRALRASACCPTAPSAMRAGIAGLAFSTAPRAGATYVPDRAAACARRPVRRAGDATGRGLRLATVLAALTPLLEDAAIAKVGHDLKFDAIVLARHGVALRGLEHRHDARQLPARRDALGASARGARARAHRLQGAARGGRLRPRRQGAVVRGAADRRGAGLRRRARRPGAAAAPARCADLLEKEQLDARLRRRSSIR